MVVPEVAVGGAGARHIRDITAFTLDGGSTVLTLGGGIALWDGGLFGLTLGAEVRRTWNHPTLLPSED